MREAEAGRSRLAIGDALVAVLARLTSVAIAASAGRLTAHRHSKRNQYRASSKNNGAYCFFSF